MQATPLVGNEEYLHASYIHMNHLNEGNELYISNDRAFEAKKR